MLALPMALYMTTEQVECVVPGLEGTQEVHNLYVFAKLPVCRKIRVAYVGVHVVNKGQVPVDVFRGPVRKVQV